LVIDEAYVLARTLFGREALDALVERIKGTPHEDFAVILCGHEDKMKAMLRDCNSGNLEISKRFDLKKKLNVFCFTGLSRCFRNEDAFYFADYNNAQLALIMENRAKDINLFIPPEVAKVAVESILAKQRAKPNFGNLDAVNNLLHHVIEQMKKRTNKTKRNGSYVISIEDLFFKTSGAPVLRAPDHLKRVDHKLGRVIQLEKKKKETRSKVNDQGL
jgi:hypothetical protein